MTVLGFQIYGVSRFYGGLFPRDASELREVSVTTKFIQTLLATTTRLADPDLNFSRVMWTICRREYYPGAMTDLMVREEFNMQCKAFTSLSESGFLDPDNRSLYRLGTCPPFSRHVSLASAFYLSTQR
jgi:hypothetical protein